MPNGDILGSGNESSNSNESSSNSMYSSEIEYLKHLSDTLDKILENSRNESQTSARDRFHSRDDFRRREETNRNSRKKRNSIGSSFDQFSDAFEEQLMDGLLGSDFKDKIKEALNTFADTAGVELQDLPKALGEELGKRAMESLKSSPIGGSIFHRFENWRSSSMQSAADSFRSGVDAYWSTHSGRTEAERRSQALRDARQRSGTSASTDTRYSRSDFTDSNESSPDENYSTDNNTSNSIIDSVGSLVADNIDFIGTAASDSIISTVQGSGIGSALQGAASAGKSLAASALPAAAALIYVDTVSSVVYDQFKKVAEAASEFADSLGDAFFRSSDSAEKAQKLANKRFQEDVKSMIEEPFNILRDAAQEVYDAWDANLRLINGTQGYTKDDLSELLSSYANRIREEGLSSVVSSVDVTESLAKVLSSGLSGAVAEEFAYQATLLNAAIPSQDFFGYADTYASIAANAIQNGMDQASAVEYANQQLQLFASNLLYSSRQLSGGFTTGLQNAEQLFQQAAQISQAAGTNNAAEISSVMTAVAGVVGAIAPDLATSMTDIIYRAATGGNSEDLVALRSLAGINASNTEFLRSLSEDPQSVFENLFNNLGNMQKMSQDNFMEVAEGLSSIFGISMDAFSRIDFNYLAQVIANMNTSTASLEENMKLLASGETTTSAEQLRMQQINKYLIDEGLSYVMDNEVARAIQQHMWDEQMAKDLMETEYAVNLKGSALNLLQSLSSGLDNVLRVISLGFIGGWSDVKQTLDEKDALEADTINLLLAGKVGQGSAQDLINLTTYGRNLDLTDDIVTLMGGTSFYSSFKGAGGASISKATGSIGDSVLDNIAASLDSQWNIAKSSSGPSSQYTWGIFAGKSIENFLRSTEPKGQYVGSNVGNVARSSTESAKSNLNAKLSQMLSDDYMSRFVEEGKSYQDWAKTAKNFGISDLSKALEESGYNEEDVKRKFQSGQANQAAQKQIERNQREELYWDNTELYLTQLNESALNMIDLQTLANETLQNSYKKLSDFYDEWVEYFVKHEVYNSAFSPDEVNRVANAEKGESQDAVYALAEALTKNDVKLLLDPTIQTNALLSQILIVVNAIMQQNNEASTGTSLPDTLSALAMGLVKSG